MRTRKVILCVDDDETCLGLRKFVLETRGYRVLAASSGRAALAMLGRSAPGEIALLLSDMVMPGMDGDELVRLAKRQRPDLPAILISGKTVAETDWFADAFLSKGASAAELRDRVHIWHSANVDRNRGSSRDWNQPRQQAQAPRQARGGVAVSAPRRAATRACW